MVQVSLRHHTFQWYKIRGRDLSNPLRLLIDKMSVGLQAVSIKPVITLDSIHDQWLACQPFLVEWLQHSVMPEKSFALFRAQVRNPLSMRTAWILGSALDQSIIIHQSLVWQGLCSRAGLWHGNVVQLTAT